MCADIKFYKQSQSLPAIHLASELLTICLDFLAATDRTKFKYIITQN